MRISTSWFAQSTAYLLDNQSATVAKLQGQMSTGLALTENADNPVAATQIAALNLNIQQTQQYQNNTNAATTSLNQESNVLANAQTILSSIHDLVVKGLSSSSTTQSQTTIATQISALASQLKGIANTQDQNGSYIFSGSLTTTQPFGAQGAGYTYQGNSSLLNIQTSPISQVTVGDSAVNVFGQPTGAAGVAGQSTNIFEALDTIIANMKANAPNSASLKDIQTAMTNVATIQSSVGARQDQLDAQTTINNNTILNLQSALSPIQSLDYAQATTQFNVANTVLQAAEQTYTKVQSLSLFTYM